MRWLRSDMAVGAALLDALGEATAIREVADRLLSADPPASGARGEGLHVAVLGLKGSACTVAAAHLAQAAARRNLGPIVYLTADHATLDDAREDFAFLLGTEEVAHFPDRGVSPYDLQIPPVRVRAGRIETLSALLRREGEGVSARSEAGETGGVAASGVASRPLVVLTTPQALFDRIPQPDHFSRFTRRLRVGDEVDMEELVAFLVRVGYQPQSLVGEYGDFSRRGGILDVYSFGREHPVRMEFDDDEIASLREFDVFTQRSLSVLPVFDVLPVWEVLVDEEDWKRAAASGFLPEFGPVRDHLEMIRNEGNFEGIEWMADGFGIPLATLLHFAGPGTIVVAEDPVMLEHRLREARAEVAAALPDGASDGASASAAESGSESRSDSEALANAESGPAALSPRPPFGRPWADHSEDIDSLAPLYSPPEALFVLSGGLAELLADHPTVYVGAGASIGRDREPPESRESPPRSKGWTAGEQLTPPDPLTEDPAAARDRGSWRRMLAREMPRRGSADEDEGLSRGRAEGRSSDAASDPASDPTAVTAKLVAEGLLWSDEEETSVLLSYTTCHFTLQTQPQERFGRNLDLTREYIARLRERGLGVTVLCDTTHHRDRLAELMHGLPATFLVGNLAAGFVVPELDLAVLTDHEIFQRLRHRRAGRRFSRGISLKELLAMKPGDYVVHIDHGIGLYLGIERLPVNAQLTDCMKLEYAGGDKLFIPVDQLNLVQKYAAEEGHRPSLSRLGTNQWAKTKARVKNSIKDMADELLRVYAMRKSRPGHAFPPDSVWQTEMEAGFPYDETPDQLTAIGEVKSDMQRDLPMDRLICGDVGYGKTEVAIRAAFKAVLDGRQVAVLVPTTLLAQQHYDTFTERLAAYPIRIAMFSRFRARKEMLAELEDLAAGKVDIAIGTHRLIQKDVRFKELGLVIIDEEQRFGVAHKERLKQMRTQVDVLTMTATPIPRTMHLALMGARDMSTIRTPPRDRRPIQTEIVEFREEVISYALMREADRGGQSFFVHNRVESIDAMANFVRRLVPHLRVAVAHGQMRERALEDVMSKFLAREYDVLVSTMIIEAGLDLPNVNTILVNRTDTFGLAQLYQLRGRVGRSARKAYAYLLIPPHRVMTEEAMKRLKAIEEFEDLGSGFQLAMRDMEIRGAGNILGAEQHGFIMNVGFDLYSRLLEEAVREVKGEPIEAKPETRIVTDIEAYLPAEYVADERERMNLYKSLADAGEVEAVDELAAELADRFGRMPIPSENLFELRRLRIMATAAGIETLTLREGRIDMEMRRALGREDVQRLLRQMPVPVSFVTHGRHRVTAERKDVRGEVLLVTRQIIECLTGS